MTNICILDTTILLNILDVPNRNNEKTMSWQTLKLI